MGNLITLDQRKWTRGRPARPFVFINMAMTADGKIATANRRLSSFGSARDQAHLFELRATADAVMCGAGTVSQADVDLGLGPERFRRQRLRRGLADHHLRIVVSGSASISPRATVFQRPVSPVVVLTTAKANARRVKALARVADAVCICGTESIDFPAALAWLRAEWRVKRLLCEGGGELNDSLFRAGLVDELHLTICPLVFGGRAAPTIADGVGAATLAEATRLRLISRRQVGQELFLVFRR
jgi:riboflavin-specific deaminase-like protein